MRIWGWIAGLGLVAVLSYFLVADLLSVDHAYERVAHHRAETLSANANGEINETCFRRTETGKSECVRKIDAANREEARQEYEFAAQRASAWWAKVTAISAIWGMALSALGVLLVWLTFREQRRTNNLARADAEAAKKETNLIARSFLAAARPRVFASTLQPSEDNKRSLRIIVTNAGQSPAIIQNVVVEILKGGKRTGAAGSKTGGFFGISSGQYETMDKPVASIKHTPDWDSATTVAGFIEYADVHGFQRRSGFSFVVCEEDGVLHINPEPRSSAWYDQDIRPADGNDSAPIAADER